MNPALNPPRAGHHANSFMIDDIGWTGFGWGMAAMSDFFRFHIDLLRIDAPLDPLNNVVIAVAMDTRWDNRHGGGLCFYHTRCFSVECYDNIGINPLRIFKIPNLTDWKSPIPDDAPPDVYRNFKIDPARADNKVAKPTDRYPFAGGAWNYFEIPMVTTRIRIHMRAYQQSKSHVLGGCDFHFDRNVYWDTRPETKGWTANETYVGGNFNLKPTNTFLTTLIHNFKCTRKSSAYGKQGDTNNPVFHCANYATNPSNITDANLRIVQVGCVADANTLDKDLCVRLNMSGLFESYFENVVGSYCVGNKLREKLCFDSCRDTKYQNGTCRRNIQDYCQGAQLLDPKSNCFDLCFSVKADQNMCNAALNSLCASREGDVFLHSQNPICACFMPIEYYKVKQQNAFGTVTGVTGPGLERMRNYIDGQTNAAGLAFRPECNFRECLAPTAPKFPVGFDNCPSQVFCLEYIDMNIKAGGNVSLKDVTVKQDISGCTTQVQELNSIITEDLHEQEEAARLVEEARLAELERQRQEAEVILQADLAAIGTADSAVVAARSAVDHSKPGTPERAAAEKKLEAALAAYKELEADIQDTENQLLDIEDQKNQEPPRSILKQENESIRTTPSTTNTSRNIWIVVGVLVTIIVIAIILFVVLRKKKT